MFFIFLKLYKWYQIAQRIKSINQKTWYHVKHDVSPPTCDICWKSKREQNPCFFQCERDDKNRSFRHWKNSNENKHTRRNTSLQKISILDAINTKNIRKLLIKDYYLLTFSYISLDGWSVQSEYLFPSWSNTLGFYFVFTLICQGINAIRLGHKKLHMVLKCLQCHYKRQYQYFSIEILRNFLCLWIYLDEEGFNLDAGGSVDIL